MTRLGIFLLGAFLIIVMAYMIKPPMDAIYTVMNSTVTLSTTESVAWRLMPLIVPLALFGILVAKVSGHFNVDKDE